MRSKRIQRPRNTIESYGRITKPTVEQPSTKKRKASPEPVESLPVVSTPRKRIRTNGLDTPAETPSKSLGRSLEVLNLQTSESPKISSFSAKLHGLPTPTASRKATPTTPRSTSDAIGLEDEDGLPQTVQDLINLNASFLTALSLHYAHHGSGTTVDVRELTPAVSRIWGKRRVKLDDLQRCMGILALAASQSIFKLVDYGKNKVCLELSACNEGTIRQPEVETMKQQFEQHIKEEWEQSEDSADDFVKAQPTAPVKTSKALERIQPFLHRGQQRLDDLLKDRPTRPSTRKRCRGDNDEDAPEPEAAEQSTKRLRDGPTNIAPPKSAPIKKTPAPILDTQPPTTSSRATSLLDRIRSKERIAASQPALSPAERARRAALGRAPEVLSILDHLLCAKGIILSPTSAVPRTSFSLVAVVKAVQGSARHPLAAADVADVLKVLGEVTRGYVKSVAFGGVNAVVVAGWRPREAEIQAWGVE